MELYIEIKQEYKSQFKLTEEMQAEKWSDSGFHLIFHFVL